VQQVTDHGRRMLYDLFVNSTTFFWPEEKLLMDICTHCYCGSFLHMKFMSQYHATLNIMHAC